MGGLSHVYFIFMYCTLKTFKVSNENRNITRAGRRTVKWKLLLLLLLLLLLFCFKMGGGGVGAHLCLLFNIVKLGLPSVEYRCYQREYKYAALTEASRCMCSRAINISTEAVDIKNRKCVRDCSGDKTQKCGHGDRLSVWFTGVVTNHHHHYRHHHHLSAVIRVMIMNVMMKTFYNYDVSYSERDE